MTFVCYDCGIEFEEPIEWMEYRGECHGSPSYEKTFGCPICQGSFDVKENEETEGEEYDC